MASIYMWALDLKMSEDLLDLEPEKNIFNSIWNSQEWSIATKYNQIVHILYKPNRWQTGLALITEIIIINFLPDLKYIFLFTSLEHPSKDKTR